MSLTAAVRGQCYQATMDFVVFGTLAPEFVTHPDDDRDPTKPGLVGEWEDADARRAVDDLFDQDWDYAHGSVWSEFDGRRVRHAWAERDDLVFDTVCGLVCRRGDYYRDGQAILIRRYPRLQAIEEYAEATRLNAPWPPGVYGGQTPRNVLCPCGSGKKYKRCCL